MKYVLALSALFVAFAVSNCFASAVPAKPGQKSSYCYYNDGPKVGKAEDLQKTMAPVLIGAACADNKGSSGFSVVDMDDYTIVEPEAEKAPTTEKAQ